MFKLKVKLPLTADVMRKLKDNLVDDELVNRVRTEVIEQTILPLIASGTSPVDTNTGSRRFTKYKDAKVYPADRKSKTPVNLNLTGVMLSWYRAYAIGKNILRMGIPSYAPQAVKDRAEGNNVGTEGGVPARRFIPLKGESFKISVMRRLKNIYAAKIARILSTKKR
jgi:hypothetical protein